MPLVRLRCAAGWGEASDDVLILFAADKLSKLRELRREIGHPAGEQRNGSRAQEPRRRRLRHYERSLALLEERLADSPLVESLQSELSGYHRDREALALKA